MVTGVANARRQQGDGSAIGCAASRNTNGNLTRLGKNWQRTKSDPPSQGSWRTRVSRLVLVSTRETMKNHDVAATWKYHDGTKHSPWSIRNNLHVLDWANRPLPFKIYPTIEPLPLPRDVPQTGVAALSAISGSVPSSSTNSVPGLQAPSAHSVLLRGNHQTARASWGSNLLSRRSLHRSSLRD